MFCTNNRNHDYKYNVFHLPENKNRCENFSAKYTCALWFGKMFRDQSNPTLVKKAVVLKVISCVCAWLIAIASLGIIPFATKSKYLSAKWEKLEKHKDGEKVNLERGDLIKKRGSKEIFIVTSADVEQFNCESDLNLCNPNLLYRWSPKEAKWNGANINYTPGYDEGNLLKQKHRW